jgi:hypothetical protein
MLLVNVGQHTINVEQVVAFSDHDDRVEIMFNARPSAGGESNGALFTLTLTGQEADRMRAWLKRNAEGVRGTAQTGFSINE